MFEYFHCKLGLLITFNEQPCAELKVRFDHVNFRLIVILQNESIFCTSLPKLSDQEVKSSLSFVYDQGYFYNLGKRAKI